jgi:predicted phosphodiesterase
MHRDPDDAGAAPEVDPLVTRGRRAGEFDASPRLELTTVTTHSATFHEGSTVEVVDGLEPASEHAHRGITFRTLPRPAGELRCRIATVNDIHFGEVEAGRLGGSDLGPIQRVPEGADPYPEVMNRATVAEIAESGPVAAVIVKGDITDDGQDEEFAAFEACYRPPFGHRLHVVRGNHDAYRGQERYAGDEWIELPGVAVALIDTVTPFHTGGNVRSEQADWLDAHAARSTVPVIVMGHHPQVLGPPGEDPSDNPDFNLSLESTALLDAVFERQRSIVAYTAGHTHGHRVQRAAGGVPSIEIGCVKDFPGTWAEYQVYDGGILQIVHRISSPEALAWSEQCRGLYADFGVDYTRFGLGRLDHRCFFIPLRA